MKKISLLTLIFWSIFSCAKIQPKVDERVELMSIIFRLAESPEYSQNYAEKYVKEIHTYFNPQKNHPVIAFSKNIRKSHGISYDAVMSMAVRLERKGNKFLIIREQEDGLDSRWTKENAREFLKLLNDFYKKSNFSKFYKAHLAEYGYAENQFAEGLKTFDESWYSKFYGKQPEEDFRIIIGYGNGGGNYGPKINKIGEKKTVFAIMGLWKFDDQNRPITDAKTYATTLIHEFNHSFVNYILDDKYKDNSVIHNAGNLLFEKQRKIMEDQAYGSGKTVINESVVRAAVINYMKDHHLPAEEISDAIRIEEFRGFLWTPQLTELLDDYSKNQSKYKTFENFYPEIVKFFAQQSQSIDALKEGYRQKQPYITSITPFNNNSLNVDYKTKTIIINFSQPLEAKGYSINLGEGGRDAMPLLRDKIEYINNNQSISLGLIDLQPDKEYEFVLTGKKFRSVSGYPIDNYTIKFKTAK